MFDRAQLIYITEVLGIDHVLQPADWSPKETSPVKLAIEGSMGAPFAVVSGKLDGAEKELLGKILQAVNVQEAAIVEVLNPVSEDQFWRLIAEQVAATSLIYFCKSEGRGEVSQFANRRCLKTLSLSSMLSGTPHEVQLRKKQVWTELKSFVRELNY